MNFVLSKLHCESAWMVSMSGLRVEEMPASTVSGQQDHMSVPNHWFLLQALTGALCGLPIHPPSGMLAQEARLSLGEREPSRRGVIRGAHHRNAISGPWNLVLASFLLVVSRPR